MPRGASAAVVAGTQAARRSGGDKGIGEIGQAEAGRRRLKARQGEGSEDGGAKAKISWDYLHSIYSRKYIALLICKVKKPKEGKPLAPKPILIRDWLWAAPLLALLIGNRGAAQTATVSVVPDADAFVRSLAPAGNYGKGGALSVSGSSAVNGSGVQQGLADSVMRFATSNVVALLDSALGEQDWIVTEARLVVTETGAPDNAIFNRGVGLFEVRWIAADGWAEGTGTPMAPTSDGVAWQDVPSILNSNLDESLGVFTNSGANGQEFFGLVLADRFLTDLRSGGEVGFYLTARSPEIGFTFNSRNFGNTNAQPVLMITAAANPRPGIDAIALAGTNVSVSFQTVSNWNYVLQVRDDLRPASSGGWSNLVSVPAQVTNGYVTLVDGAAKPKRFYRLSVSR